MEVDWRSGVQTYYQKGQNSAIKKCKSLKTVIPNRPANTKSNGSSLFYFLAL